MFEPGQAVVIKPHTTHNYHKEPRAAVVNRMMAGNKYVILDVPYWQVRARVEDVETA